MRDEKLTPRRGRILGIMELYPLLTAIHGLLLRADCPRSSLTSLAGLCNVVFVFALLHMVKQLHVQAIVLSAQMYELVGCHECPHRRGRVFKAQLLDVTQIM
jgi:hypothetical protein